MTPEQVRPARDLLTRPAVARLRAEGHDLKDEDVARPSPLKGRHTNFVGRHKFDFTAGGPGQGLAAPA